VFVKGNDVGHALFVEIGGGIRQEIISESPIAQKQQKVKGGYRGTGEAPCPLISLLENTPIYRLAKMSVRFENVLV
jgi:hypothetical protein